MFKKLLVGYLTQLVPQRRDSVVTVVQGIAKQKKTTLLGGKQKHQAHHDSESSLVKVPLADTIQETSLLLDVNAVESLNQNLHCLQHLLTKLVSDFLLI
ncbi:Uncharacterised protein [Burkholderia pseudomallei]|nr:Uncharacterised protein [Burkholderia pseudomallei]